MIKGGPCKERENERQEEIRKEGREKIVWKPRKKGKAKLFKNKVKKRVRVEIGELKPKKKQQRLAAERNLEHLKDNGWVEVKKVNELTLMEKEI